ncbi:helix-turn-helix domain-containing protein [Aquipuribacter sp. MA13-6]|uniref:helix-turn-helix domain-containing protein n=1 Tax=unclassified Aquipuribacter TaxID=2635084 RepID=UPI003EEDDD06
MLRDVVAVLAEPVAAFELGVVSEVFGLDRSGDGLPGYDFDVCAATPGVLATTSGFAVTVAHDLTRLGRADLVVVPSWPVAQVPSAPLVTALRAAGTRGARLLGVCSGTFLLAAAGLLDGRRATTHWRYSALLAQQHPAVTVDADVLYVVDGPVTTSAGTAAGIDACLHLVREEHGAAVANAVARRMVVAPHRGGGQAQFVEAPVASPDDSTGLAELLHWARAHLGEELTVDVLAARAHVSPRTLARRFVQQTGVPPHRWVLDQRLLVAEDLLTGSDLTVEQVARRSGLGSADTLRHHLGARRRLSPSAYRRTFRGASVGSADV